ncbi:MAG: FAD-binding oxidoreductase [Variovorax sp.]
MSRRFRLEALDIFYNIVAFISTEEPPMHERNTDPSMDADEEYDGRPASETEAHFLDLAMRAAGVIDPASAVEGVAAPVPICAPVGTLDALVVRVIRETESVSSFEFRPLGAEARAFRPRPGQFVPLRVSIDGAVHERCYAVSSLVARGDVPRLTIKRVPSGLVSNWCHDRLKAGMRVSIGPVAGRFRLRPGRSPLVFMAAGIGIAPLFPMFKEALLHGRRAITMMVFDRDAESAVFLKTMRTLARKHAARLQLVEIYAGDAGAISQDAIRQKLAGLANADVYMCGPAGFMQCAETAAQCVGVSPDRIFINAR